jgi:hypothetical protein
MFEIKRIFFHFRGLNVLNVQKGAFMVGVPKRSVIEK